MTVFFEYIAKMAWLVYLTSAPEFEPDRILDKRDSKSAQVFSNLVNSSFLLDLV